MVLLLKIHGIMSYFGSLIKLDLAGMQAHKMGG